MKTHRITGGGGIQLHAVETGNPTGRPVVFLHGASQSWLTWERQLESTLASDHRLVALDLRGHGLSDKPRDGYGDSRLWADDIDAVLKALYLERPVLSGWSYGPLVFLDYIRHHGDGRIGGLQFVGGASRLGGGQARADVSREFLQLIPQLFSTDTETTVRSMDRLVDLCFARELSAAERYEMLGYSVSVPPYVRHGLFSRSVDNHDLLATIRKPVLITHGARDAVVNLSVVEQHKSAIPHAEVDVVPNAGHGVFRDDPVAFNERLRAFCQSL